MRYNYNNIKLVTLAVAGLLIFVWIKRSGTHNGRLQRSLLNLNLGAGKMPVTKSLKKSQLYIVLENGNLKNINKGLVTGFPFYWYVNMDFWFASYRRSWMHQSYAQKRL
jgi:hypothetical protein